MSVFASMDERFTTSQSREFAAKFERIFFMAQLGRVLRRLHDEVVREPLPPKLEALMKRLVETNR
jgi:Anti-sigma factor NepR